MDQIPFTYRHFFKCLAGIALRLFLNETGEMVYIYESVYVIEGPGMEPMVNHFPVSWLPNSK